MPPCGRRTDNAHRRAQAFIVLFADINIGNLTVNIVVPYGVARGREDCIGIAQ